MLQPPQKSRLETGRTNIGFLAEGRWLIPRIAAAAFERVGLGEIPIEKFNRKVPTGIRASVSLARVALSPNDGFGNFDQLVDSEGFEQDRVLLQTRLAGLDD